MRQKKLFVKNWLIGTWKSDRKMTFHHQNPLRSSQRKAGLRFRRLFGKMIVRWDRTTFSSEFNGQNSTTTYKVVGGDSQSVVIRHWEKLRREFVFTQIHFSDPDRYCLMTLIPGVVEWFKRIE